MVDQKILAVPSEILALYGDVIIAADIMFMNEAPLLVTISHHLKFVTMTDLKNMSTMEILKGVRMTRNMYHSIGSQVVEC